MPQPDTRAYRSKIGRLPFAVRNELCERMLDGATGAALCDWLNGLPEVAAAIRAAGGAPVNQTNLSDWRATGYAAWMASRERARHVRDYAETAQHIAAAAGGDPAAVGSRILAGKMLDLMEAVDADTADAFSAAVARLRKGETDADKIALGREKNELARQDLALRTAAFRRATCEMFLKWYADKTAASIADGPGTNDDKIRALLAYMDKEEQS